MNKNWDKDWIKTLMLSKSRVEVDVVNPNNVTKDELRKMVNFNGNPVLNMESKVNSSYSMPESSIRTTLMSISPSVSVSTRIPVDGSVVGGMGGKEDCHLISTSGSEFLYQNYAQAVGFGPSSKAISLVTTSSSSSNQPMHQKATVMQQPQQKAERQFKCDQCNMFFGSKSAHTSHVKSHAKQYAQLQQQQQHQLDNVNESVSGENGVGGSGSAVTTGSDPYQCDVCKKTFAVPARLVRHYRTHTGERPFECEFCHKMFSVKENLQVHRRIHTKERPYKCDVCGRAFEHSGKLHRHMRIHTGERPHKCSVCGKTFIQSGQLVIHMRTHTGEKPYKCPVDGCGKGFTCSKQLKVHSRTHTGEKPYHCDICFRDFGYNHVLKLHRVQHYGSKCYKCTICDETFKNKKEMEAHIKGHANEIPDEEEDALSRENEMNVAGGSSMGAGSPSVDGMEMEEQHMGGMGGQRPIQIETPRESSSEATNSDNDTEFSYYNLYSRKDGGMSTTGGVNPALLAAASIAAAANSVLGNSSEKELNGGSIKDEYREDNRSYLENCSGEDNRRLAPSQAYHYEPFAVMRQNGYYIPTPQTSDFRSSLNSSSDLVKRVEAALASTEPMLTPPRSSPESPERSSSPDSESGLLMADRDVMSLPLRKRKLYLKDDQHPDQSKVTVMSGNNNANQSMRKSSVIQFAKAS